MPSCTTENAYECHGYTTTDLALGSTPSQGRVHRVVSLSPQLLAERCLVKFILMSTVPRHLNRFQSSLTVMCNPGDATVTGLARGAARYSVSCGASGQWSYTSHWCAPSVPASVVQGTSAVTAGLFVRGRRVQYQHLRDDATREFVQRAHLVLSTLIYDVLAESTPTAITSTGEMRLSDALWYDGQPF